MLLRGLGTECIKLPSAKTVCCGDRSTAQHSSKVTAKHLAAGWFGPPSCAVITKPHQCATQQQAEELQGNTDPPFLCPTHFQTPAPHPPTPRRLPGCTQSSSPHPPAAARSSGSCAVSRPASRSAAPSRTAAVATSGMLSDSLARHRHSHLSSSRLEGESDTTGSSAANHLSSTCRGAGEGDTSNRGRQGGQKRHKARSQHNFGGPECTCFTCRNVSFAPLPLYPPPHLQQVCHP